MQATQTPPGTVAKPVIPEDIARFETKRRSIRRSVRAFLDREPQRFDGTRVLDLPAGQGLTSGRLTELGARVDPFDLFPEAFRVQGLECRRADVMEGVPVEAETYDHAFCQEGIEHFSDQFKALRELNRVLKVGGNLYLTTPNYSNLRAKVSYLLCESELSGRRAPLNERDDVWIPEKADGAIYFGHVFLTGVMRLRVQARLAGFELKRVLPTRWRTSALMLFPFLYPPIWWSTRRSCRKASSKHDGDAEARAMYDELHRLGTNRDVLLGSHLFLEFEKIVGTASGTQVPPAGSDVATGSV
jgi:SAM-dependent methyltransferase